VRIVSQAPPGNSDGALSVASPARWNSIQARSRTAIWSDISTEAVRTAALVAMALTVWAASAIADTRQPDADGPILTFDRADLFQDAFPADGTFSGPVRVDAARDTGVPGGPILPQDTAIITVQPGPASTSIAGVKMVWALLANPLFHTQRASALTQLGAAQVGIGCETWPIYSGEVDGTALGGGRYAFDLPDGDPVPGSGGGTENPLMFPGDKLHYYFEATDGGGVGWGEVINGGFGMVLDAGAGLGLGGGFTGTGFAFTGFGLGAGGAGLGLLICTASGRPAWGFLTGLLTRLTR